MSIRKVGILLLVVFAIVLPDPVSGGCWFCKKPCTKTQKNYIVDVCHRYILKSNYARVLPTKHDICCIEVRTLQSNGEGMMQCITDLLTREERLEYDVMVMLYLKRYCTQPPIPAPPHYEVKSHVMMILFRLVARAQHASVR